MKTIITFTFLVTSMTSLIANGPVLVKWPSQTHQGVQELYIYNVHQQLVIETKNIFSLAESYRIIGQNIPIILQSFHNAFLSQVQKVSINVQAQFLYFSQKKLIQRGKISKKQKLPNITLKPKKEKNSTNFFDSIYIYMESKNKVYETRKQYTNINPTCGLISPISTQLVVQHQCYTVTPLQFIENQLFSKQYDQFNIHYQGIYLDEKQTELEYEIITDKNETELQKLQFSDEIKVYSFEKNRELWIVVENEGEKMTFLKIQVYLKELIFQKQLFLQPKEKTILVLSLESFGWGQLMVKIKNSDKRYGFFFIQQKNHEKQNEKGKQGEKAKQQPFPIIIIIVGSAVFFLIIIGVVFKHFKKEVKKEQKTEIQAKLSQKIDEKPKTSCPTADTLDSENKTGLIPSISDSNFNTSIIMEEMSDI